VKKRLYLIRSQPSTKTNYSPKPLTPGQNTVANFLNGLISALMAGGEKAALLYALSQAPSLFSIPIVGSIAKGLLSWLLGVIGGAISQVVEKTTDAIVIDIQVRGEESAVMQAGTALQLASAGGDPAAIEKAKEQASNALVDLIHMDGWGTTT
jgi:hypothetical protein